MTKSHAKPKTMRQALGHLRRRGITTTTDLDVYARQLDRKDPDGNPYIPSRYQTLAHLVGENAAISILHELATTQCCPPPREG